MKRMGEMKQVTTAIMIKHAFIPGEIIPRSSPIFEAAIIRLNLEANKIPPVNALLKPNNLDHNKAGKILTPYSVTTRNIRKSHNELSNSRRAAGSN